MAQPKLVNTAVRGILRTPVAHRIGSSYWHSGTAVAIRDEEEAIAGMATLVKGCPRYAGWINIGQDSDHEPLRQDLEREVRDGRVLIRVGDLRPLSFGT